MYAQNLTLSGNGMPAWVLSLPSTPADGDQVVLVDSLTAPTYHWLLRYVAAASTYKWYCIGGTPYWAQVNTSEATTSTTFTDLTTPGPSFTVPVGGDWLVEIGCYLTGPTAGNVGYMSFAVGGTAASDSDAAGNSSGAASMSVTRSVKKTGVGAASSIATKYRTTNAANSATFNARWLKIMPYRVG